MRVSSNDRDDRNGLRGYVQFDKYTHRDQTQFDKYTSSILRDSNRKGAGSKAQGDQSLNKNCRAFALCRV